MKIKNLRRLSVTVLAIALLTTAALSGTTAKYVTSVTGSDSARVARWWIVITDANGVDKEHNQDFLLQPSILAEDTSSPVDTSSITEGTIAPGTHGRLADFTIKNKSEVTAEATATITVEPAEGAVIPDKFVLYVYKDYKGDETDKPIETVNFSQAKQNATITVGFERLIYATGTGNVTILWEWDYADGDENDTAVGTADAHQINIGASVVVSQVKPTAAQG